MDAHKLPLSGKKLYLDLKGYGKHDIQILEQNLSLLGAVSFLAQLDLSEIQN